MPDVVIHGFAGSTYVRTARLALEEKGVPHELRPLKFKSPEHLALHPFGKMPAMTHGNLTLFETSAICRYIDEAFDGPPLQPADVVARARMEQWMSAFDGAFYEPLVHGLYFPARRADQAGTELDPATIAEPLAKVSHALAVVEAAHDPGPWLVGGQLTLADLFFAPVIALAEKLELTAHLFDQTPQVAQAITALRARPSWAATQG